jgi:hypothetical protein
MSLTRRAAYRARSLLIAPARCLSRPLAAYRARSLLIAPARCLSRPLAVVASLQPFRITRKAR